MKSWEKCALLVVGATCAGPLVLQLFPAAFDYVLMLGFVAACLLLPVGGIVLFLWMLVSAMRGRPDRWPKRPVAAGWACGMLACTALLLVLQVPVRVAFLGMRGGFEALRAEVELAAAATQDSAGGSSLSRRVGIYEIDQCAADARGGLYFRVATSPDMVDTISYGVAHRPNRDGSPFGGAEYHLRWLGGEWYWFEASNDWR